MTNAWKKVLCSLLIATCIGGCLLIANSELIKEELLPFAKQLAEDIIKNIDWSDFDVSDADQYKMANYDISDKAKNNITSSAPFVWFRGYSNSDFSDKSNMYTNVAITATKKTSTPLTFYAEKIDSTINNNTFNNTNFDINISLKTSLTTTKLNNTKMVYLLDPIYCDDYLSTLSDDNKKRCSDVSSIYNYSTTIRPYYNHELCQQAEFEDEKIESDEKSYYNDIKDKYLDPLTSKKHDIKDNLKKYLSENNLNPKSDDINSIMEVKDFLNGKQFSYISEVEYSSSYDKGDDAALYFLKKSKKGDDKLISWAACELYRANDIPARTCTGFIGIGGTCYLFLTHTWTEVYVEGNGWIKVDASIRKRFVNENATNITSDMPSLDLSNLSTSTSSSYSGTVDNIIRAGVLAVVKQAISKVVDSALDNKLISTSMANTIKEDDELVIRLAKELIDAYEDGREITQDYLYDFIKEYFKEKGIDIIGIDNMTVVNPLPDCFYPEVGTKIGYYDNGYYYTANHKRITYIEYYNEKPDGLTDEEWNKIKHEYIQDKRTKIKLKMKDCAKVYEDKDLLPDWENYAEIQSITMYIQQVDIPEWTKSYLNSIFNIEDNYNFNDTVSIDKDSLAILFSQYNFTYSDLNSYLSYSLSVPDLYTEEDGFKNKEFIFNLCPEYSSAQLDIHYPNIATITKDNYQNNNRTSFVPAMITCRDTSNPVDEDYDGIYDTYADGSIIYKDITDKYYDITCVDGDDEYTSSQWQESEDDDSDTVTFSHYKTFTAYSNESELKQHYDHCYTVNTESNDIVTTLDEVKNGTLDIKIKDNQPQMISGNLLYSGSGNEDHIYFESTVDTSEITKSGTYLYTYNVVIENESGVTRYNSSNYLTQLKSMYNVSKKFGLIKVQ